MTIYESWIKKAYNDKGQAVKKFWDDEYMPAEQKVYENIIKNKRTEFKGTLKSFSMEFNMSPEFVIGFLDGIHEVSTPPTEVKDLEEDTIIEFSIELKALYKKMVEFKAEHLYTLPEWNEVFSPDEQRELYFEQKKSGTIVKGSKPSRNDPCPCGSGVKYKKCCGA